MWFQVAAERGDGRGARGREMVAELMTPEEIDKAGRLAREWTARRAR